MDKNVGGRPKKEESDVRNKCVKVRLTQKEYNNLYIESAMTGKKISEVIRKRLF